MTKNPDRRIVYVSHPASGLARSNFPLECHVEDGKIVRSLPFYIPDDVRLYEIETTKRGRYSRPRKEVQMPLAFAAKQRVHANTRVKYPLLRDGWDPDNPNAAGRGTDSFSPISWDKALDIIVGQLEKDTRQIRLDGTGAGSGRWAWSERLSAIAAFLGPLPVRYAART